MGGRSGAAEVAAWSSRHSSDSSASSPTSGAASRRGRHAERPPGRPHFLRSLARAFGAVRRSSDGSLVNGWAQDGNHRHSATQLRIPRPAPGRLAVAAEDGCAAAVTRQAMVILARSAASTRCNGLIRCASLYVLCSITPGFCAAAIPQGSETADLRLP